MLRKIFVLLLACYTGASFAKPYYGANFSYSLIAKEPPHARAYQIMLKYDPQCFKLKNWDVYFDGGFSHFWVNNTPYYTTVNIYSIAPILRRTFTKRWLFHPYLELSIGISYLNHTRLDSRNLGIHFAFQDRIGMGTFLGNAEQLSIGLHIMHYSNASFSVHNSGLTMPLVLDIGYRFR